MNYSGTIEFFRAVRRKTLKITRGVAMHPTGRRGGRIGVIKHFQDFSKIKYISPGASLMLAAEYERISRVSGVAPATIDVHKWHPSVVNRLSQLGYFDLLRLPYVVPPSSDKIIIVPMVSDQSAALGPSIEAIKELFSRIGGDKGLRIQLSSAVTDAIENVVGHAYPSDMPHRAFYVPFWWFLGAADPVNNQIFLTIYDHGITIPASLPKKWPLVDVARVFAGLFGISFQPDTTRFDGEAIHAAMSIGKTSTGKAHRGLGLDKIRKIVQACHSGQLRIVSRNGECIYRADGSHEILSHDVELSGTYVELRASFAHGDVSVDRSGAIDSEGLQPPSSRTLS